MKRRGVHIWGVLMFVHLVFHPFSNSIEPPNSATDLLHFLRKEQQKLSEGSKLPAAQWLHKAPLTAGVSTLSAAENQIKDALETLHKNKHVKIQRPKGAKSALKEWVVELLP